MSFTVLYDEAHCETWTIDLSQAKSISPSQAEYNFHGHMAELVSDVLSVKAGRLRVNWTRERLQQADVLVIAHPASPAVERGCEGNPIFTDDDISLLADFVDGGGGLFVLGEYSASSWGSNITNVTARFGLRLMDDMLKTSRGDRNPHILARHFLCQPLVRHPVTRGIDQISYHRGCSVRCSGPGIPVLAAPDGEPICGVSQYGDGRVVVIGDSDLFSIPFIGHYDNAQFYANTLAWLAGAPASLNSRKARSLARVMREKSYVLTDFGGREDLAQIPGDHIFDASGLGTQIPSSVTSINPYSDLENFLLESELAFQALPECLRRVVTRFKRYSNDYGALLLRGLSRDTDLPCTPADSRLSASKRTFNSEFWLSAVGSFLGNPFSYIQEKDGELFQNVCPTPQNEESLSSESSRILLDFHTETAFHPIMPDYLLLYCLRSDHEGRAATIVSSTKMMIPSLPLKYRALLFEDMFRTGIDFSFGSQSGKKANGPVLPVLYGDPYDPLMKFDPDLMAGTSEDASGALEAMKSVARQNEKLVFLTSGDMLIVDNRRAIHGRSSFKRAMMAMIGGCSGCTCRRISLRQRKIDEETSE